MSWYIQGICPSHTWRHAGGPFLNCGNRDQDLTERRNRALIVLTTKMFKIRYSSFGSTPEGPPRNPPAGCRGPGHERRDVMTRRHLIRMDDDEVAAFLAEQHLLQLATIDHDGWPHLVTMWYALLDGQIAFWTYAKSQKAVNLRRDQRLTCLIETGDDYPDARGVQIKG